MKYIIKDFEPIDIQFVIDKIKLKYNITTSNPGHLGRSVNKVTGMKLKDLILKEYENEFPKCIFSNKPLDAFVHSRYQILPYRDEYKANVKVINMFYNFNMRNAVEFPFEYLHWDYMRGLNKNPLDIYNIILFLQQNRYLIKYFSENEYDRIMSKSGIRVKWSEDKKLNLINNLMNCTIVEVPRVFSNEGIEFRGLDEETSIRIKDFMRTNASQNAFDSESSKRAIERKLNKYTKEELKSFSIKNINFWLNKGYSQADAKDIISEIQNTTGYQKNISKFGFEEGIKRTKRFVEKRKNTFNNKSKSELEEIYSKQDSCSMKWALNKYKDRDVAIRERNKVILSRTRRLDRTSKESIKCLIPLYKKIRMELGIDRDDVFWGIGNRDEYFLRSENGIRYYDFTIKSKKIIVEYHGEVWHGQKSLAGDTTANDEHKRSLALKHNFSYYVIWSNYSKKQIEEIFRLIYEEIQNKY